jgi:hypothetical protein
MTTDTIAQPLDRLRARYPAALVCTVCMTLLATRPASYIRSGLTEAARLTYICAECRADQAEAARMAAARRTNLVAARRAQSARKGTDTRSDEQTPSRPSPFRGVAGRFSVTPGPLAHHHRGPGRPRLAPEDRGRRAQEGNRARQRLYRARQRAGVAAGRGVG